MASYDDLNIPTRLFMAGYPFSRYKINSAPCAPLVKPLAQSRIALVTTGGLYTPDQAPFDASIKMGDTSFREIPGDTKVNELRESHKSKAFDHSGVARDRNLVLPLDRIREMASRGEIGKINRRHFSFMGSIVGPGQLIRDTAPEVARLLREDCVDAVLLTPL